MVNIKEGEDGVAKIFFAKMENGSSVFFDPTINKPFIKESKKFNKSKYKYEMTIKGRFKKVNYKIEV